MGRFFVMLYDYLRGHRAVMWGLLVGSLILLSAAALRVRYQENITSFFPKSGARMGVVFDNLRVKDKMVVMLSRRDSTVSDYDLEDCADRVAAALAAETDFTRAADFVAGVDDRRIGTMTDFVYRHLPVLLDSAAYARLDSLTSPEAVRAAMERNYENMRSPIGGFLYDYLVRDPLGIGSPVLRDLQRQAGAIDYRTDGSYLFSADGQTLLCFIEPRFGSNSRESARLIEAIERVFEQEQAASPTIAIDYFGAPAVAAYNARQIKADTMLTLNLALVVIVAFLFLAFRNKWSILLIITPVGYGALFALAAVGIFFGEISLIAVGSGAVIFGIALSYSIHMLSHTNHCSDMRQLIRELAYPLTVGSFTTIGAFIGLLFTDSRLLQDFGFFAAFTLIGTTLYSLVFLPQFIRLDGSDAPRNRLLRGVERIAAARTDRNRLLVGAILVVTLIGSLYCNRVGFDSNMMRLNYEPEHLRRGEEMLSRVTQKADSVVNVILVSASERAENAVAGYARLCRRLDSLQREGIVQGSGSIDRFVISNEEQQRRLAQWQQFWSKERRADLCAQVDREAERLGFEAEMFAPFAEELETDYEPLDYASSEVDSLLVDWVSERGNVTLFVAQARLVAANKTQLYASFADDEEIIAVDRAFFASRLAADVNDNFYLILYISSLLIFAALLISYGRIELTLLSFMPMCVSWVIILGLMALFGVEFNIVTIILSTFIFGIGDDFSIFIMDGLQSHYRDRSELLPMHKTAIFFSAFTVLVGMGTLVFARHPALYPLGVISLLGILVVVLVAYTVQPLLFRKLISEPAEKGGHPYTLTSLLVTTYDFALFVTGCVVLNVYIGMLYLLPVGSARRKRWAHRAVCEVIRLFFRLTICGRYETRNNGGETFRQPAVVVANHQSVVDILILLAMTPRLVMVTKGWVWRLPLVGWLVRAIDCYKIDEGAKIWPNCCVAKSMRGIAWRSFRREAARWTVGSDASTRGLSSWLNSYRSTCCPW